MDFLRWIRKSIFRERARADSAKEHFLRCPSVAFFWKNKSSAFHDVNFRIRRLVKRKTL